jgi:hypothetical protein
MEEDPLAADIPPHVLLVSDCWCAQDTGTEVEAMVEDMEEGPLTTDIPLHVLFANDCLCAQAMGTEEVEATVEDMEEDQSYRYPPHVFVNDCSRALVRM